MIAAAFPYQKQRRRVLGGEMAYVEVGEGDPIVLLHGNPTSSYLWRNVLPHLQSLGRCIAPDLIGMGDSDKLPNSGPGSYRFVEHRRYLDALLEALDVRERVTLVIHDWGSGLGFDWANRHRKAVKGIAFMEAIVRPQGWDHWDIMNMRPFLQALRSDAGEKMVLEENFFIEKIDPTFPDGSRTEPSGRGYFNGIYNGLDVTVKDSKKFPETNGWGFFNFGHHPEPYADWAKVMPATECGFCHKAYVAKTDMTWVQFYPMLHAKQ